MINLSEAVIRVKNPVFVGREHVLPRIDVQRDRSLSQVLQQLGAVVHRHRVVVVDLHPCFSLAVVVTCAIHRLVAVVAFQDQEVFLVKPVLVRRSGITTNAPCTPIDLLWYARHELLLSKTEQLTGFDSVGALKSSNCGKGPAGTTLSLVLYWGDFVMLTPVEGHGNGLGWEGSVSFGNDGLGTEAI